MIIQVICTANYYINRHDGVLQHRVLYIVIMWLAPVKYQGCLIRSFENLGRDKIKLPKRTDSVGVERWA